MARRELSSTKVSMLRNIARFTRDGYGFPFTSVDKRVRDSLIRDKLLEHRANTLVYVTSDGMAAIGA